jgi:hypothetical protein
VTLRIGVAAIALAVALAGCGGGDDSAAGGDSAATIAPATAVAYATINTDVDSDQWEQADELLQRFPGRAELLDFLRESLSQEGVDWENEVKPALGPTIELVALGFETFDQDVVGLAKPKDETKFKQLLEEGDDPVVVRKLDDWTIFADSEATLDRFEQAQGEGSLADQEDFEELMAELPEEALAKAWLDTSAAAEAVGRLSGAGPLPQSFVGTPVAAAAALEATEDGARLLARFRNTDVDVEGVDFGELSELVPSDAYAFLNFHGQDGQLKVTELLRDVPAAEAAIGEAERAIGVTLEDVATLFNKEMVLWVRPSAIIPEVTLVLEVEDEAAAEATVDRIVSAAGNLTPLERRPRQIGDVDATEIDLGEVDLLYATIDGKLVVTTQRSGIEAAAGGEDRLVDEGRYKDTVEAAGVTDDENVVLWVDIASVLGLVETAAGMADESIPRDVRDNLEPLNAVVFSQEPLFEEGTMRLFLSVR